MSGGGYLDDPDMIKRVFDFINSGLDPNGYYVSAKTLAEQIQKVEEVTEDFKSKLIGILGLTEVEEGDLVDCFKLGWVIAGIIGVLTQGEQVELNKVVGHINNLDNVPFVNIKGVSVQ